MGYLSSLDVSRSFSGTESEFGLEIEAFTQEWWTQGSNIDFTTLGTE